MGDFKYQKLKEIRTGRGYTQAEMAELIGIARTTYADYEKGRILPPIDKIKRICSVFGLPLSELTSIQDDVAKMDRNSTEYAVYMQQQIIAERNVQALEAAQRAVDDALLTSDEAALINSALNILYKKYRGVIKC